MADCLERVAQPTEAKDNYHKDIQIKFLTAQVMAAKRKVEEQNASVARLARGLLDYELGANGGDGDHIQNHNPIPDNAKQGTGHHAYLMKKLRCLEKENKRRRKQNSELRDQEAYLTYQLSCASAEAFQLRGIVHQNYREIEWLNHRLHDLQRTAYQSDQEKQETQSPVEE